MCTHVMWIDKSIKSNDFFSRHRHTSEARGIDEMAQTSVEVEKLKFFFFLVKFFLFRVIKGEKQTTTGERTLKRIEEKNCELMEIFNACARTLFRFFFRQDWLISSSSSSRLRFSRILELSSSEKLLDFMYTSEWARRIPMSQIKNNFFSFSFLLLLHTNDSSKDNDTERKRHNDDDAVTDDNSTHEAASSSWKIEGVFEILFSPEFILFTQKKEATEDREGKECRARRRERVSVNTHFFSVGWRFFLLHRVFLSPLIQQRWRR